MDLAPELGHLDRELRLNAEPIRFEAKALEDVAPEDLVPHLHVAQVEIRDYVAEVREILVPQVVPEVEHAMGTTMVSKIKVTGV